MTEINSLKAKIYSRLGQRGTVFGMVSLDVAAKKPRVIILTADLAQLSGLERFAMKYPSQFINVGIAEQNMMGVAAGLASEGYKPVATTYATFVTLRSCEQIRHYMGYMGMNIVVVGTGAGLIQSFSGATHYSVEDIAVMRSIPNVTVIAPSDAGMAAKAFESAVEHEGSVYMRLTGGLNCPVVYKEDFNYQIGKSIIVKDGCDVTIFATGLMVAHSLKSAAMLEEQGVSVRVVDMHTVKPVDKEIIKNSFSCRLLVSVEEHSVIGGLGGAIAEEISQYGNCPPLLRLGINDVFVMAGDYEYLLGKYRLLPEQIAQDIATKVRQH